MQKNIHKYMWQFFSKPSLFYMRSNERAVVEERYEIPNSFFAFDNSKKKGDTKADQFSLYNNQNQLKT